MKNKIVLITGGTGGIGKHTAIGLAKQGAQVVVTGRDRNKGQAAVLEIAQQSQNNRVDLLVADLSSLSGIRKLAHDFSAKYPQLDVLVNNAGLLEDTRRETADGIEAHFAVNVLAPYLLTLELLPKLKNSASPRVLNLTGGLPGSHLHLDDLFAKKSFVGLLTYTRAKHAMETMSAEMAERLKPFGVDVFVVFPGTAATAMTSVMNANYLPFALKPFAAIFQRIMKPDNGKSAAKAARSSIYAASAEDLRGATGLYINTNSQRQNMAAKHRDSRNRSIVWATLEQLSK
jgi:NAD(P)-dependent dehydrogenase (short-subunit alcohol dehydrogenase family)